ncbi:hypothetical protein Hanom_Chr14g01317831 [Helianthus anomalus]
MVVVVVVVEVVGGGGVGVEVEVVGGGGDSKSLDQGHPVPFKRLRKKNGVGFYLNKYYFHLCCCIPIFEEFGSGFFWFLFVLVLFTCSFRMRF